MDAQHFPEQGGEILRVAARLDVTGASVVGRAAVTARDIEIVIVARAWAEADPAAVVIGLRLVKGEDGSFARCIGDIRIGRDVEARDVSHALAPKAAGRDVVNVKAAVGRVVPIEGQPKKALLADERDNAGEIEKRRLFHRACGQVDDADLAALLDHKDTGRIPGRSGDKRGRLNPPATRTASRPWTAWA